MKTLIIYFSYSGNNRFLAEHLAKRMESDLCPIVEQKRRTLLTILLDMLFRREPKIKPLECAVSDYEQIILVSPVWGSKLATPLKSLIKSEKSALSSYSFITFCGYDRPEQKEGITKELSALAGRSPKAVAELKISDLFPAEKRNDIKKITRYRATAADLVKLAPQIDSFIQLVRAAP
jgi:menaquinone-dependent protoporphyrinogen IX oxidase